MIDAPGAQRIPPDAQRIVSLLPGATEWVCQLGLADRLVGISHECDFPDLVRTLPRVTQSKIDSTLSSRDIDETVKSFSETKTSLYDLDERKLCALKPDLILTQTLCNVCAVSERDVLKCVGNFEQDCVILDLPARTLSDVLNDARTIWKVTGQTDSGVLAMDAMDTRVALVRDAVGNHCSIDPLSRPKVTLLEWLDPLYCSGHWTPELIQWAGGVDPIGQVGQPSRVLSLEELVNANPDILLVACCGMNEERTKRELTAVRSGKLAGGDSWRGLDAVRNQHVYPFDGSAFFNRPGPRLVDALEAVANIIEAWHSGKLKSKQAGEGT